MPKFINMVGKVFGNWTVLKKEAIVKGHQYWECKCFCGEIKRVLGESLRTGVSKSCGCLRKPNLIGNTYGKLKVIDIGKKIKNWQYWKCVCECGCRKEILTSSLTSGGTISCGCHRRNIHATHGHTRGKSTSKTWNTWCKINRRCNDVSAVGYYRYGGRGITVCDKWLTFKGFYEDMGDRPEGMSIDRINNDGNYCKENCRWATSKEQNNNTSNNRIIEFNGQTKTLMQWSETLLIGYQTLSSRINYSKWSIEKAFTTPIRHTVRKRK